MLEDDFSYIWIDICCIVQSSSAEVSEAINSMYKWYELSHRCYVYLDDFKGNNLKQCEWYTRGWTLHELVAPTELVFYDLGWKSIGIKSSLSKHIADITRITEDVLINGLHHLQGLSVAEKMSWAAGRITSRDRAYSLMGAFWRLYATSPWRGRFTRL